MSTFEKKILAVVALTSVTVPFTVPLKTALAIAHCPSVSLSARMSAHCILQKKTHTCTEKYTNTNKMSKTYSNPAGLSFRRSSSPVFS